MKKIAVLGAGISGISAAFHAQKKHKDTQITLYEKLNEWGGLCGGFYVNSSKGKFWFDNAVHLSLATDEYVKQTFENFSTPYKYTPNMINYYQGYWVKHPAQNNLFGLPTDIKVKALKDMIENTNKKEDLQNFEEWLKAQYGTFFAENFPMKYTRKYWTLEAKELNVNKDWVGPRFYRPNLEEILQGAMTDDTPVTYYAQEQRYPKEGKYKSFLKNLVKELNIACNKEVINIDTKNKILTFSNKEQSPYDTLISTIPIPEMANLIPTTPQEVKHAAQQLHATKVAIISLGFNKPNIMKNLWFYVYDEEIFFARVYSPSEKSPANVPQGCSSLQAEIYFSAFKSLENIAKKDSNLPQYFINHTKEQLIKMEICKEEYIICEDFRILPYGNVMFTHGIEKIAKSC
ncbi:protoporphyrinogen/coproporphyrinogen oxidase [Helicobacter sp.]|uniref:protoporphyrinogen/coproporphyrinogen oxidase n=1 Tax=Helicobacter sp. TaxID=218 RepID=UPI0025C0E6B4|nr:FAD-dependent oxidoreductase [Helicobacter sp.]MCI5969436.1 FAD-dependent oxidoreductase [Helicobacter sp.]MDY2585691.1 FAD-dependent oxidoreductase [Helicobacter sp.]